MRLNMPIDTINNSRRRLRRKLLLPGHLHVRRQVKPLARTTGWTCVIAGTLLFQASRPVWRESGWLGLLPGVGAILFLVGLVFIIRWYFREDGGAPKWARRTLTIVGVLLLIVFMLNTLTLGALLGGLVGS